MMFPMFFGGYTDDTTIEQVDIDSNQNILIAGNSDDLSFVTFAG